MHLVLTVLVLAIQDTRATLTPVALLLHLITATTELPLSVLVLLMQVVHSSPIVRPKSKVGIVIPIIQNPVIAASRMTLVITILVKPVFMDVELITPIVLLSVKSVIHMRRIFVMV